MKAASRAGFLFAALLLTLLLGMRPTLGEGPARAHFLDGLELLNQGNSKAAIAKLEQGLQLEPDNAGARLHLAEAYLDVGRMADAREQLRRCVLLEPDGAIGERARARLLELFPNATAGSMVVSGVDSDLPAPGSVFQDCAQCPELVVVPAGRFLMGSPLNESGRFDGEGPQHRVLFDQPYAIGKYEVSFDQWEACVAARVCARVGDESWGRGRRPVINITYEQALGYTEWLAEISARKYRLPSEAEWEYAARGGSDKARPWGNAPDRVCEYANVNDLSSVAKNHFGWEYFACDDGYAHTTLGWFIQTQRIWSVRHAWQRGRMGCRLLQPELRGRAGRRTRQ